MTLAPSGKSTAPTVVGIDPSSRKLAFAAITTDGHISHSVHPIPNLRGAQRLHHIRALTVNTLQGYGTPHVIVVEVPWGRVSSFVLLSIAGVLMEAAQEAFPHAVVLDMPTQVWKKWSVGPGNSSKGEVMEFAQARGYDGDDQDVADAVGMCVAGWEAWSRRTEAA